MLGLVVACLLPASSPSSGPHEWEQLLCVLGLSAVGEFLSWDWSSFSVNVPESPWDPPSFVCINQLYPGFRDTLTWWQMSDAPKRGKVVGHTGHAQHGRKVSFIPETVQSQLKIFVQLFISNSDFVRSRKGMPVCIIYKRLRNNKLSRIMLGWILLYRARTQILENQNVNIFYCWKLCQDQIYSRLSFLSTISTWIY